MSTKPTLRELALEMDQLSWAEVKSMAIHLDMDFTALTRIQEGSLDISDRINSTMQAWLKSDHAASWEKVVTALNAINKNVMSKEIKNKYIKGTARLEASDSASPEAGECLSFWWDVYLLEGCLPNVVQGCLTSGIVHIYSVSHIP